MLKISLRHIEDAAFVIFFFFSVSIIEKAIVASMNWQPFCQVFCMSEISLH